MRATEAPTFDLTLPRFDGHLRIPQVVREEVSYGPGAALVQPDVKAGDRSVGGSGALTGALVRPTTESRW